MVRFLLGIAVGLILHFWIVGYVVLGKRYEQWSFLINAFGFILPVTVLHLTKFPADDLTMAGILLVFLYDMTAGFIKIHVK